MPVAELLERAAGAGPSAQTGGLRERGQHLLGDRTAGTVRQGGQLSQSGPQGALLRGCANGTFPALSPVPLRSRCPPSCPRPGSL